MALRPNLGEPWLFGLHQCSHARTWTPQEEKLFEEIGRRLSDALNSLLMYRILQKSEREFRSLAEHSPERRNANAPALRGDSHRKGR
jgi:GAF domain-containing protein